MKKLFTLCLLAAATAFSGCESLGLKNIEMDSEDGVKRVAESLKKYIDPAEYKAVSLFWTEVDKLSNNLAYLTVEMVGTDNLRYSQMFKIAGDNQGPSGEMKESNTRIKYDFATMKYLTPEDIDPDAIIGWLVEGAAGIPEGYACRSVGNYTMQIDPVSGDKTSNFELLVIEENNSHSVEGHNLVITYHEIEFDVLADGTVVMEEFE